MSNAKEPVDAIIESPEFKALLKKAFQVEPSAKADAAILAHAAQSVRLPGSSSLTISPNSHLEAANEAIFELVHIRLKAAASNTNNTHSRMTHKVGDVVYGEIEFVQYDDEVDITYRLLPSHIAQLVGCAVRIRLGDTFFDLGTLDAEGKAGDTVPINRLPIECDCQFLRPIDN